MKNMKQLITNKIKSIGIDNALTAALIAFILLMVIGCIMAATGTISIENGEIKIN